MRSIRRVVAVGLVGGAMALTAACGGGSGANGGNGGGGSAAKADLAAGAASAKPTEAAPSSKTPKVSTAAVSIEPKAGSVDVAPNALKVGATGGKLTTVKVSDKTGKEVPGTISADGASWTPAAGLEVGTAYRVSAMAADADGAVATADSDFTTLTPTALAKASDNVDDNATYGVGMIVSVNFSKDVKNRDEVARGISFETSNGTVVKGHWFGDRRLDFRPEQYWAPDTKVTVKYRLKSVEIAPGVYGADRDEPFTIGRSQISTVDAAAHKMTVVQGGQSSEIDISAGAPEHPTWNGTMVVMSKEGVVRMQSSSMPGMTGAPYDLQVPHSMRLTDSGTYVHGNYWSSSRTFGEDNVSHGCVGLKDVEGGGSGTSAGKFYDGSLIGDVMIVKNSIRKETLDPSNGLSGWNVPWSAW
ncbi:Ig-like domain-containing protein [Kitasatospora sp. MY 5-36]|uniref:L,D-transpeptidase n=1 Tax=Kitasatospora sp. MY 5-36 TaxID=1678027 RepID=UPI000670D5BC|nr:Ig-like domain-containing protein [Kitasatospora sp. MY 5-36]